MLQFFGDFLNKGTNLVIFMTALPLFCGALLWIFKKQYITTLVIAILSLATNLLLALGLSLHSEFFIKIPYAPLDFEILFRSYSLSSLFIVITAIVFLLIVIYTVSSLENKNYKGLYLFYLFASIAMINGALLSDSLGLMLFFIEALLFPLFGILLIKNKNNPKTAVKALTLQGFSVLLLMLGIIITTHIAGTSAVSEIKPLDISGEGLCGFLCMIIGSLGISSIMPFHTWVPDAADDSPTGFMASFPVAIQGILGVYISVVTVLKIYNFVPESFGSVLITSLGAVTFILAGGMMLYQNNLKRFLSYCVISQIGFIAMGIGTGLSSGIYGGIYGLINFVFSISGLFLISGIIKERMGTKDIRQINGLYKNSPILEICFIILSLSVLGLPGLNGFQSMQLIFDATLKTNIIFYIFAIFGAFLTALSFLRVGISLFSGENKMTVDKKLHNKSFGLIMPVIILSALCIRIYPLNDLIQKAIKIGEIPSITLASIIVSLLVLLISICCYVFLYRKAKTELSSTGHLIKVPIIKSIYNGIQKRAYDPYNWLVAVVGAFSDLCVLIERGVSHVYDKLIPGIVKGMGLALHRFDNGHLSRYLYLAVSGLIFITLVFSLVK